MNQTKQPIIKKIISICFLIIASIIISFSNTKEVNAIEILQDTNFSNGFGNCFWLGKNYNPGPEILRKGICNSYQNTADFYPKTIPNDDDLSVKENNIDKYWEFNEGTHSDPEIFNFRLPINHQIINNTPSNFSFVQKNPNTSALIKQVSTDKHGQIYLYFNSKNEIRNTAIDNGPEFSQDTWPHFQLGQYFREYIPLGNYQQINVGLDIKVNQWEILPNWPHANDPNAANPGFSINMYTFLRKKDSLANGIFIGTTLFSNNPDNYSQLASVDQLGQGYFRHDVTSLGGPANTTDYTNINFDLIQVIQKALQNSPYNYDEYVLSAVEIGYEGMGWFESAFTLKNLSMNAILNSDLNQDGSVNIFDCNLLLQGFGDKYDIFDYNQLVQNYGK